MKHRLFAVLLLVAAATALPAPAHAAACTGTSGVTVVVDFDNGTTRVGCAPGDPASGYQALQQAGFSITLATGNGSGALCSIDSVPNHACPSMPPADAYWAYFHAERGGSWNYSTVGGGGYDPKPGSVEGWHFRGNRSDPPAVAPPAAPSTPKPTPAPKPGPKPTTKPSGTAAPVPGPGASGTSTGPSAGATPTDSTSASASAGATASTATTNGVTDTVTDPATGAATVTDASTPLARPDDGDASWVWGVVIVAVLGAVAGGLVLRRRRA